MTQFKHFGQLRWPGNERSNHGSLRLFNKLFKRLRLPFRLEVALDPKKDMVSIEQVSNLHLLLASILQERIVGDLVEVGCYTGATSTVIASCLEGEPDRRFHVYDIFEHSLDGVGNVEQTFRHRFKELQLPLPHIHKGDIRTTLPTELPDKISFAHIDLGIGGDANDHSNAVIHALGSIYERLYRGGVIVLMDYHLPEITVKGFDSNPGMRIAADHFFKDKPEKVITIYGGAYSHAFVRKM